MRRKSRELRGLSLFLGRVACVVIMLGLWQLASNRLFPDFVTSSPVHVAVKLKQLFVTGQVWPNLEVTIEELILGYAIGVGTGLVCGIALGYWRWAGALLEPIINALNSVPHIALAPLFLLVLGLGIWSKVAIAALIVGFVMFNNVFSGMRTLPDNLIQAVAIIGGKQLAQIRWVVLPSLASGIMAGLKAGAPFAMIGVIVGEFIAADSGIGYYIRNASQNFDSAGLWAGLVILVVIVIAMNLLLRRAERFVFRWRS